jgi:hypothetical protein
VRIGLSLHTFAPLAILVAEQFVAPLPLSAGTNGLCNNAGADRHDGSDVRALKPTKLARDSHILGFRSLNEIVDKRGGGWANLTTLKPCYGGPSWRVSLSGHSRQFFRKVVRETWRERWRPICKTFRSDCSLPPCHRSFQFFIPEV